MTSRCIVLSVGLLMLALIGGCNAGPSSAEDQETFKPFSQLEEDLRLVTDAGYTQVCLFDLQSIAQYPDPRYASRLASYSDDGLEISVYVKFLDPDQETLDLVRSIGASSVIVFEEDLATFFSEAGVQVFWWSLVAYPPSHTDQPGFLEWPDLRSEQVREHLANWSVQIPAGVDGGLSLDYIRWNEIGEGRSAEQVTDLTQRIRDKWDAVGDGSLSAAVYPYLGRNASDGGALSVGQKWNEWLETGLVDYAYPMAYSSKDLPRNIREWASYDKDRIIPCLSVRDY